jgi:hypothetical protein
MFALDTFENGMDIDESTGDQDSAIHVFQNYYGLGEREYITFVTKFCRLHDLWLQRLVDRANMGQYNGYINLPKTRFEATVDFTMWDPDTERENFITATSMLHVGETEYICVFSVGIETKTVAMMMDKSGESLNAVVSVGKKRSVTESRVEESLDVMPSELLRSCCKHWFATSTVLPKYFFKQPLDEIPLQLWSRGHRHMHGRA